MTRQGEPATTVIQTGAGNNIINLGGGNNVVSITAGGNDIITTGNGKRALPFLHRIIIVERGNGLSSLIVCVNLSL